MPTLVRWLLVPVAAYGIWWAAIVTGLLAISVLDSFCPPEQVVSDLCAAPWHAPAVDAIAAVLSGFTAFGMIMVTFAMAPSHNVHTAVATYLGGAAFAAFVAAGGGMRGPFVGAAIGGTVALLLRVHPGRRRTTAASTPADTRP